MDDETKERIADFFDAWDLVAFLQVSTRDIIEAFPEELEEALEDIEDIMDVRKRERNATE